MNKRKLRIILSIAVVVLLVGGFLVNKYILNQSDIPADSAAKSAPQTGD